MVKQVKINVCQRCGVIMSISLEVFFTGLQAGSHVNLIKCDDCKFSLRNLWNALTKKEES